MTTGAVAIRRWLALPAGTGGQAALLVALLALLGVFIVMPLLQVLTVATSSADGVTLRHLVTALARPHFRAALLNTLVAGVAAVTLGSVVALPLALLVARYRFPGRDLVQALAVLPLVVPPYVGAFALHEILGRADTLPIRAPFREGLVGVVLVQTLNCFPLIMLNTAVALHAIDPAAEEAARMMGCRGWRLVRRVALPLALPGFAAGALLAFVRVIDDLGTPLMLNYSTLLAPQAYLRATTAGANDVDGAVICVVLLVLSLLALGSAKVFLVRADWVSVARGTATTPRRLRGIRLAGAWLLAGLLLGLALLPHVGVVTLSVADAWSSSYLPAGWTIDHYVEVLVRAPHVVWNTLRYAALAAGVDVALGVAVAWLLVRGQVRGRRLLDAVATVPLGVPGVVLAIGFLQLFPGWVVPGLGTALTASWVVLVVAYAVRRLPYTVRACDAALQRLHASMEESALSLGATPMGAFRRITLPLVTRGLLVGGLIAFVTAAVELSSTILLVPRPELGPLSYGVYVSAQSATGRGPAAALGAIAIGLVAIGIGLVHRVTSRGAAAVFRL